MQSIKGGAGGGPFGGPGGQFGGGAVNPALQHVFQQESEKMRQMQQKKMELEHNLSMLNNQILKCQGALEILQNMK